MSTQFRNTVILFAAALLSPSAWAQQDVMNEGFFDQIAQCRSGNDERERLRCYDRAADALAAARGRQPLTVVPKAEIEARVAEAARSSASAAQRERSRPPAIQSLESTVSQVTASGKETLRIVLADGSVWRTTEAARPEPRKGDRVQIRRAALGSYIGSFPGDRSVRLQRVR